MLGLGSTHTFSLKEARERAGPHDNNSLMGLIRWRPNAQPRRRPLWRPRAPSPLRRPLTQYNAAHEAQWRNARHRAQFLASMRQYAFPIIGNMTVS